MSADGFDEVDRALASGLAALAPQVDGGDEALAALRPRLQRARTRARVAKTGGAIAALFIAGSLATLLAPHSARSRVSVSSQTSTPETVPRPAAASTTIPSGVVGGAATTTTVSTSTTGKRNVSPTTAATVIVPVTTPSGGPPANGPSTTTTVPTAALHEYTSPSGSISVRFSNGTVTLLRVSPAPGLAADVRDAGPDRVEVRFTLDGSEKSRIELRVENGILVRIDHSEG